MRRKGELVLSGCKFSVLQSRVLEMDGSEGSTTMQMCSAPLNHAFKLAEMVNFLLCSLQQLKKKVRKNITLWCNIKNIKLGLKEPEFSSLHFHCDLSQVILLH